MQADDWLVGVDVGGTFTDFYAFDRASGTIALHKTSSTPDNAADAIVSGLRELAEKTGFPLQAVRSLAHGTTVATNALIQRRGARVAVVTTENFRDLVEIGRQIRPKLYDLKTDHPMPLAPREMRFEVRERVGAAGEVVTPLDEASVDAVIEKLKACKAEAVAIAFLFSYLNPAHEEAVRARIQAALPKIAISISSQVQPEFREYERSSTTLLNAYLQPAFSHYMTTLKDALAEMSPKATVGINQSSGGLMSVDKARDFPIRTALSGPAAGAMGAIHTARLSGRANIVTLDMGGTSADVALIRNLETKLSFDRDVAGFPVRMPMVDINTVGAGGGSLAWFDRDGLVKVGPVSAGAVPGPACYGRGGTEPTVTDANVVLGRLSGHGLLGGSMTLDEDASRRAVGKIAERLGFTVERTAKGILDIVSANMVRAIRAISVERGHDPREFVLMPFGGAGPLHAEGCARALGIKEIIIPYSPGILCAQGLLVADRAESFVRSGRLALAEENASELAELVSSMMAEAEGWWEAEAVEPQARSRKLAIDMRYASQNYELQVGLDELPSVEELRRLFFEAHEQAYGFHNPADPVDVMAVRLTAIGRLPSPGTPPIGAGASATPEPRTYRPVWFDGEAAIETPIYDRASFAPGTRIEGPAVIDQFDATSLLFPKDVATVDDALNIVITRGDAS
ncbi:hydantoinase/oxoprolinase family protein [Jiella pacifica]|uniref:Hydantoinase/oxoprolinase family protein n=1 Tax=Jiella pacifica TaxID=2696469 RepID=A0A6N9TAS3_9HYPH|nr:hydantoinase/oxoprolinase family protein [Jiella pacifica]NDW05998.1 hydantoinase/oxoprolinase family protein [Jiella pacifica]